MRLYYLICLSASFLAGCATETTIAGGDGFKAVTELTADKGAQVCMSKLKGGDHEAVVSYLGCPQRKHGEEEYLYYPKRANGSRWLLLVSFDDKDRVVNVFGDEL